MLEAQRLNLRTLEVGNSRRGRWTRLLSIPGQYNYCNNLRGHCTGFVLFICASGAGTRARG
jgi:hypothetical protein